jgi:hypothetical protein
MLIFRKYFTLYKVRNINHKAAVRIPRKNSAYRECAIVYPPCFKNRFV